MDRLKHVSPRYSNKKEREDEALSLRCLQRSEMRAVYKIFRYVQLKLDVNIKGKS